MSSETVSAPEEGHTAWPGTLTSTRFLTRPGQCPDDTADAQSSQHSLPPVISTIISPYTGLKYATKNIQNYISNAAMSISVTKAVTDKQTTTVKDSSKAMSTGNGSSDFHHSYHAHGNQSIEQKQQNKF